MNDMIINAAQDPSCILAVTPDRGGSWWAALRPDTPRNFAEKPTAFYDCQSICSEKIDPSHDYRFLFDSEIVSDKIECSMFYADAAGFPFGIYCHPTNQINCFTNLFRVSSSPSSQYTNTSVYNGESRLQGRHVIEMEIAGNSLKTYLDGVLINRPSGFVRTGVATCDLPQCNSGYVYRIQIEDLTTGEIVWRASRDELYETNPWPSATPINFADEPVAFTDSFTAQNEIETDDFTLSVDFTLSRQNVHGTINIGCMRCLYYDTTKGHQLGVRILKSDGTKDTLYPVGTSHILENVASINVIKTVQSVRVVVCARDGSTIRDGTATIPDGATVASSSGVTTYPGSISAASIRNDTTGEIVWRYPSEAERVRLLTKTNVRTDRGVFEAADNEQQAYVQTALELPNTSHTIIWRGSFTPPPDDATIMRDNQTCYSCGSVGSGNNWLALRPRRLEACLKLSNYTNIIVVAEYAELSDRANTVAVVLDKEHENFSAYLNGAHKGTFSNIGTSDVVSSWPVSLGRKYKMAQTDFLLVFDRALSAAEIAALCPTSN